MSPPRFRAGAPGDYAVNSVTYFPGEHVFLLRSQQGFYAEPPFARTSIVWSGGTRRKT